MALIAAHLNESFWWWQCSDRYIISLFPHLHSPIPNKPYGFCGRKASWKKNRLKNGEFVRYQREADGIKLVSRFNVLSTRQNYLYQDQQKTAVNGKANARRWENLRLLLFGTLFHINKITHWLHNGLHVCFNLFGTLFHINKITHWLHSGSRVCVKSFDTPRV